MHVSIALFYIVTLPTFASIVDLKRDAPTLRREPNTDDSRFPYRHDSEWGAIFLTHSHPDFLERAMKSFFSLAGAESFDVTVSLDNPGAVEQTIPVIKRMQAKFPYLINRVRLAIFPSPSSHDGETRVTNHVLLALSLLFQGSNKYGLFLEDDLIFSPDFLEFMMKGADVIEKDESLFCVSAWNGVPGTNPRKFNRMDYFPGLGWLTTKSRLQEMFMEGGVMKRPTFKNWDWWFTTELKNTGKGCIYPEVPRSHHFGHGGVHVSMDDFSYDKLPFADIPAGVGTFRHVLDGLTKPN